MGGDAATYVGNVRAVPGGIHEEVLASERGKFFEYTVKSGPFPVKYHRGRVDFVAAEDSSGTTLVRWSCSYTPIFLMGPVVSKIITISFGVMLRHLANSALPANTSPL